MKKRIISALKNKKGESYLDIVILVFVSMMAIVLTLNVFSYLTLKQDMDYIATELVEVAALEGLTKCSEIEKAFDDLCESTGIDASYKVTAEDYYNSSKHEVQLGDPITVTVTCQTTFRGLGALGESIDITVESSKMGLSRVYFKD